MSFDPFAAGVLVGELKAKVDSLQQQVNAVASQSMQRDAKLEADIQKLANTVAGLGEAT